MLRLTKGSRAVRALDLFAQKIRTFSLLVVAGALLCAAGGAQAVEQVLDSVDGYGLDAANVPAVLEMGFRAPPDFKRLAIGSAAGLVACQRAADQRLYCIDGNILRLWPITDVLVPAPPASGGVIPDIDLINCRDPALGFDQNPRKPSPCTGMTVDLNGAIWLAGRKANSHSLVKVIERTGPTCDSGWTQLNPVAQDLPNTIDTPVGNPQHVPVFCAREYAPGRPVLVDVTAVDGEVAANYTGPGILGLEARKAVVFFPDEVDINGVPLQPREIAGGKTWGLSGKEELFGAAFLQIAAIEESETQPAVPLQNFVLVTTTNGRVLATKADGSGTPSPVFTMPTCSSTATQSYGIRVSSQSERVYVSDRACGRILALKWTNVTDGQFQLVSATKGGDAVTLSTGSVLPDGLSVAPGIGINLKDCGVGKSCPLVADDANKNNIVAAEIRNVVIEGEKSAATVFQVRNIPDCRYWPQATAGQTPTAVQELCATPGVIQCGPDGEVCKNGETAREQYLDIGPLLPSDVTLQFKTAELPELLISPRYRGQDRNAGKVDAAYEPTIDLFFFVTEPGVQFRDTFELSFDVSDLTGRVNLGCGGSMTSQPDLKWDVGLTGSEKVKAVEGGEFANIGMLVTKGCFNPTSKGGARLSFYTYTMEVVSDEDDDAVYVHLVRSLFADLRQAQQDTACNSVDPATGSAPGALPVKDAPLGTVTCDSLNSRWDNANVKLESCIQGATFPKQNQAVNNCQSFLSQLANYRTTIVEAIPNGPDPANRIGELEVRTDALKYVFEWHFLNSIPAEGFRSPTTPVSSSP